MDPQQRRTPRTRIRIQPENVAPGNAMGRCEMIRDAGLLVVAFHLPELEMAHIGHRIDGRILHVWSKRRGLPYQAMYPLPLNVEPTDRYLRHKNGLFEFVFSGRRWPHHA